MQATKQQAITAMDNFLLTNLIGQYKSDSESVYNTWFIGSEARMKAFRSIRRGVRDTIDCIAKLC